MPGTQFGVTDRPRDIVDGAGRWLAEQLGWRWVKSRGDVELRDGPQVLRLGLQPSKWNRAGAATWASARVTVLDDELPSWRGAHLEGTLFPAPARPPLEGTLFPAPARPPRYFVYSSLLINIEPGLATVECSGLLQSPLGLSDFAAAFTRRILPVLRLFRSPGVAARRLPDPWLAMAGCETVEWALARNDPDAAGLLIRRHLQRPLRGQQTWQGRIEPFRRGWELAAGGDRLSQALLPFGTESLGWLACVHGLVDPRALQEPRPGS